MGERSYQETIARGLTEALGRAKRLDWDLDETRLIVFSDLHRGQRNHADDFRHCEETFRRALGFYFEAGYTLVVLGDAEELWEGWPGKVVPAYESSLELESEFHRTNTNRYFRVWGNHDDIWQYPSRVSKHLGSIFGALPVPEGLDVTLHRNGGRVGRVFLVHGHQGTPGSDKWARLSRHFVRWVWRPIQRLTKISVTTPAENWELRGKHDRAMYDWAAERNDLVLIAGHTHNPVFVSRPHVATLERLEGKVAGESFEAVNPEQTGQRDHIEEEIAWAKVESSVVGSETAGTGRDRSCYFNAGCCSFSNGDITGIEIVEGRIRLVRWSKDLDRPAHRVLEAQDLTGVFAALSS